MMSQSTTQTAERNEFAAGWRVLIAAILGVMCGFSPIPFNTFGLFMGPLNAEYGWGFGEMSLAITIFGLTGAFLAPVFGYLADRFGVRHVAILSLTAFAFTFAAFYFTPAAILGFYALSFVMGLVGIGSTPITWSRAVNMWFFKNRGLALGITLLGTSFAALVVPRLTVWGIENVGWRATFPLIALLPLLVALPVALLWFREPRPEERPAGLQTKPGGVLAGLTLKEAMGGYRFWLLFGSICLVALAYGGAHIHLPNMVRDKGYSPEVAAGVMGMVGVALFAGRIITGMLLDRFWAPLVTLPILSLPAVACFMLTQNDLSLQMVYVSAFVLGFAAGAESDLIAYLAGRYFGMAHYGKIYGTLYMPFGIFSALSPLMYGTLRDSSGSYDSVLMIAAALFVTGAVLLLGLGRYPDLSGAGQSDGDNPEPIHT